MVVKILDPEDVKAPVIPDFIGQDTARREEQKRLLAEKPKIMEAEDVPESAALVPPMPKPVVPTPANPVVEITPEEPKTPEPEEQPQFISNIIQQSLTSLTDKQNQGLELTANELAFLEQHSGAAGAITTGDPTSRLVDIAMQQAQGQPLSEEDTRFLIEQQISASQAPQIEAGQALASAEERFIERADQLKRNRDEILKERQQLLGETARTERDQLQLAAEREKEAAQSSLSFSGFGRSITANNTMQGIQAKYNDQILAVDRAKNLELKMLQRELQGADQQELDALRGEIDNLRMTAEALGYSNASDVAGQNAFDAVSALNAVQNVLSVLPQNVAETVDKDLTNLINDGYLYTSKNGIPVRVVGPDGQAIKTGVNGEQNSSLSFSPPKTDAFGNIVSPGYIFDKTSGALQLIDPQTGLSTGTISLSGDSQYLGAQNAIETYKNFDAYTAITGNGNVVSGSPYHSGFEIDIDGKIGDPITAFASGRVIEVENTCRPGDRSCGGGYGNYVVIETGDGNRIRYAHLESSNVSIGQMVGSGVLIGEMGNTGQVIGINGGDGSHLHIEARDADGNLIGLDSVSPQNTFQRPIGSELDVNAIRAEAFQKGYVTDAEVQGYINSVRHGYTPPDRSAIEMNDNDFNRANTLRDEFNGMETVQDFKIVKQKAEFFVDVVNSPFGGPGDLTLVYEFMKALDPNSVVREAEFDSAAESGSIFRGAYTKFNGQFNEGEFLPEQVKNEFLELVLKQLETRNTSFQQELSRYTDLASKSGVDADFVVSDYSEGIEDLFKSSMFTTDDSDLPFTLSEDAKADIEAGVYTLQQIKQAYENAGIDQLIEAGIITQ